MLDLGQALTQYLLEMPQEGTMIKVPILLLLDLMLDSLGKAPTQLLLVLMPVMLVKANHL